MQIFQKRSLVISIHDVSPQTEAVVEVMLHDLRKCGVLHCSLLVIPNHHHKGVIASDSAFMQWLREKQKEGHEIVLHGFYHLRPARAAENFWTRWITQSYTTGEGEFYDLTYKEARAKLQAGKEEFHRTGFQENEIIGFIAPAWLLSAEAERAVVDEGFSYTTRLGGVIDLRGSPSTFYQSQSMVYSVRSAWRRQISLLWNEILFRYAQKKKWSLLRLGLHPPDWKYDSIRHHALTTVQRALQDRELMTYQCWLQQH